MSITGEIRKRPWLLLGTVAIALLSFLINGDSLDKFFGKNPNILGKVNGEEISRDEFNDQLTLLQQQSQGQPQQGLEEQAWQTLVQSKLIKQQFDDMGLKLTDDIFWNQLQFDPMFSKDKNPQNFDEKGNFKIQEVKKRIEGLKEGDVLQYNNWLKARKGIEYRMMARQLFANISTGITANKKEATEMLKQRDEQANIDFVKVDYAAFAAKNPVKVTTQDLADYVNKHPVMFKSDATRNLGIVFFPAKPSATDDAVALKEINKLYKEGVDNGNGLESFSNTKNDSMFVELNSEAQIKYSFVSEQEVPKEAAEFVKTAAIGQVFGPYKSDDKYYVTKLEGKSVATLPKHILITHKDTSIGKQDKSVTRTKEEAKKLAEEITAQVKANPSSFQQFLPQSADGSSQQGGSLGWSLATERKFVKPFQDFVNNSAVGTVGMVETEFGYHIIVIENKMPVYKIANLAKDIKASKETENRVYTEANTFIQSNQGKSFNEFTNAAKKKNYNFQNPKSLKRFQGKIEGLGTDKDEEILSWAFGKKLEKGETNIFTTGNGDYIVTYLNGKQDAGTADPESVRDQIEAIVKNKLLAKKISEKITSAKATNLEAIAKLFATNKQSAQINMFSPNVGGAMEPKVAGAAFGTGLNKISAPVEGITGVYIVSKKSVTTNKQPGDTKQIMEAMKQQASQMFGQSLMKSLQDNSKIEDFRIEVWDKANKAQ